MATLPKPPSTKCNLFDFQFKNLLNNVGREIKKMEVNYQHAP